MIQAQKRFSWSLAQTVAFVWGGGIVAGLLAAVVERAPIPGILQLAIATPLAIVVALFVVLLVSSQLSNIKIDQLWPQLISALPFAFIAGSIAGMLGIWNDGSGTVALAPLDAILFVITGGLLPLGFGPTAVVRITILASCVIIMLILRARQLHAPRAVLIGFASWVAASIILLSESWITLVASLTRGLAFQNALDATRILGALHTNSYWSNFQADRFLVGIGQQVQVASTLSSAALMVLLAVVVMKLILLQTLKQRMTALVALAKRLWGRAFLLVASPLVACFLLGIHNQRYNWNGLDIIAALLAVVVFCAWFMWWHFGRDIEDLATDEVAHPSRPLPSGIVQLDELQMIRSMLLPIAFIGAFLLGWPVLALTIALFVVSFMASSDAFGWSQATQWRIPVWSLIACFVGLLGGAVGFRGAVLPRQIFADALVWAILTGILVWQKKRPIQSAFWLRYGFFILLGAGWAITIILSR
ncbi:MAG: hypothetical protein ABIO72_00555 [Patescibacteria group bacterium]